MPDLILGPFLRHVGSSDATVWVETDSPCEVEVSVENVSHRSPTFRVGNHYYALVYVTNLEPGSAYEYALTLDGEEVWPEAGSPFPRPSSGLRATGRPSSSCSGRAGSPPPTNRRTR